MGEFNEILLENRDSNHFHRLSDENCSFSLNFRVLEIENKGPNF